MDAEVLDQVSVGDILRVQLRNGNHADPIVALTESGQILGPIADNLFEQLLMCLRLRFGYSAEVLEIDDGRCDVFVRSS